MNTCSMFNHLASQINTIFYVCNESKSLQQMHWWILAQNLVPAKTVIKLLYANSYALFGRRAGIRLISSAALALPTRDLILPRKSGFEPSSHFVLSDKTKKAWKWKRQQTACHRRRQRQLFGFIGRRRRRRSFHTWDPAIYLSGSQSVPAQKRPEKNPRLIDQIQFSNHLTACHLQDIHPTLNILWETFGPKMDPEIEAWVKLGESTQFKSLKIRG